MKYYKIVDPSGHNGLKYHEGLNVDPLPFNPSGDCKPGGIYFSKEDILAFLWAGTELYEVEPVGPVYENPSKPQKYKAHAVYLKYVGKVIDNIEFLINEGADVHADDDFALSWAIKQDNLELVKLLLKYGADVNALMGLPLVESVLRENLEIIKYLLQHGADIHANNDEAIKLAEVSGNKKIANLIKQYC